MTMCMTTMSCKVVGRCLRKILSLVYLCRCCLYFLFFITHMKSNILNICIYMLCLGCKLMMQRISMMGLIQIMKLMILMVL